MNKTTAFSCECEKYVGAPRRGVKCPECGSEVKLNGSKIVRRDMQQFALSLFVVIALGFLLHFNFKNISYSSLILLAAYIVALIDLNIKSNLIQPWFIAR